IELDLIDHANVAALKLAENRALRGKPPRLLGKSLTPILGALLLCVAAALLDRVADAAGAGVAGALLAEHLSRRSGNLAARQRSNRAVPLIGVIHHQRLLEQIRSHSPAELGLIDVARFHLLAGLVVDRYLDHVTC